MFIALFVVLTLDNLIGRFVVVCNVGPTFGMALQDGWRAFSTANPPIARDFSTITITTCRLCKTTLINIPTCKSNPLLFEFQRV